MTERVWPGQWAARSRSRPRPSRGRSPTASSQRPAPERADLPLLRVQHGDAAAPGDPAADAAERDRPRPRGEDRDRLRRRCRPASPPRPSPPPRRSRTRSTSASRTPTTQHPLPHAPDPPHPKPLHLRRARLLHDHRHGGDGGERAVRRRRVRGRQRRPPADPRLAGPQAGLRRGRGRDQLLPVPPQPGPGLLDEVHQRPGAERDREPAGQPGVERHRHRPAALAQGGRARTNQYTIELLPANGNARLRGEQPEHDDRLGDELLQGPRHRQVRRERKLKRSIVASFRRRSFLDFLYFTDFETTDPVNYSSANQSWAQTNCGDKYRAQRDSSCSEIQFADADAINGPMHTNDDILTCGTPTFGRNSADSIEMTGPAPGFTKVGGGCPGGDPVFNGPEARRREGADDAARPTRRCRRSPPPAASSTPARRSSASTAAAT